MTQTFAQFGFKPFIDAALKEIGFKEPTEVQARLIPLILKGEALSDSLKREAARRILFCCRFFKRLIRN